MDQAQATFHRRILRAFVGRSLLEGFEAQEILAYRHSGFSVDTSVCITAHDRAGLERLLRYSARPPFACALLPKQHSEPGGSPHNKRGSKVDEFTLTPLELIDRIAALVPPPLFRCAGPELTAQGSGGGTGAQLFRPDAELLVREAIPGCRSPEKIRIS